MATNCLYKDIYYTIYYISCSYIPCSQCILELLRLHAFNNKVEDMLINMCDDNIIYNSIQNENNCILNKNLIEKITKYEINSIYQPISLY